MQSSPSQADSRWGLAHARFKGAMRRLAVPCADEYDEEEYTEAIEAFFLATKQFSAHSRCSTTRSLLAYCPMLCLILMMDAVQLKTRQQYFMMREGDAERCQRDDKLLCRVAPPSPCTAAASSAELTLSVAPQAALAPALGRAAPGGAAVAGGGAGGASERQRGKPPWPTARSWSSCWRSASGRRWASAALCRTRCSPSCCSRPTAHPVRSVCGPYQPLPLPSLAQSSFKPADVHARA